MRIPIFFPTFVFQTIFIGNGGLGCGIQRELLMNIFGFYGPLENILMLPDRPYSFVVYKYIEDATKAMASINGEKLKSGYIFYLAYINGKFLLILSISHA